LKIPPAYSLNVVQNVKSARKKTNLYADVLRKFYENFFDDFWYNQCQKSAEMNTEFGEAEIFGILEGGFAKKL